MLKVTKWVGIVLSMLILVAGLAYVVASRAASAKLARSFHPHSVDISVPMPLSETEVAELRTQQGEGDEPDLAAIALERAISRGKHLVGARFVCMECHGEDFGGGVMVDDPAMGSLLGPNLTTGAGSVTADYTMADWDRIVRHGIRRDGHPAVMPSEDFVGMSDRELSDIIAYIRSLPPVDREVPRSTLGPVGKILLATGKWRLSADMIGDHSAGHRVEPPAAGETVEFGAHLAQVCTGCHREHFEGGPIVQGPPSWAPAANLTPHAEGLASWSYEQFAAVMQEGKRPDGSVVREPMTLMTPYGKRMKETELKALWRFLQSLDPRSSGG